MTSTKLIIHIGAGKTGSSSIQATLNAHDTILKERGVHYLGLALEHAVSGVRYDWQNIAAIPELLDPETWEDRYRELTAVLKDELEALSAKGVTTAIWSNEALFLQNQATVHALKDLQSSGVPIEIIGYLRRHDNWARSAYQQWGIKHKTYSGPLKTFKEWRQTFHVVFAQYIDVWEGHFGSAFNLRNFEALDDVAADFLEVIGQGDLNPHRVYESPSLDVLRAWAVYNARSDQPIMPARFEQILNASRINHNGDDPLRHFETYLPSEEDLTALLGERKPDIDRINQLFEKKNQPPFTTERKSRQTMMPTPWETDLVLLKMVYHLQDQVEQLQHQVRMLAEQKK